MRIGIVKSSAIQKHGRLDACFYLINQAEKEVQSAQRRLSKAEQHLAEAQEDAKKEQRRIAQMLVDGTVTP